VTLNYANHLFDVLLETWSGGDHTVAHGVRSSPSCVTVASWRRSSAKPQPFQSVPNANVWSAKQ
jgi:hypothetical protein